MATMFAGPNNVYTPHFDEQAKLIVNYSRDPKKFVCNQLMTVSSVKLQEGYYPKIKPETQGRTSSDMRKGRKWAPGNPRPIQVNNGLKVEWLSYKAYRNIADVPIDYTTEQQAVFDIVSVQSAHLASLMMTDRAAELYTVLADTSNYDSNNTATATAAGGGQWSAATSTNRYIQKSLRAGVEAVIKATMNGVTADDLYLVISPVVAGKMAESAEIADYLAQNPVAKEYLQGNAFAQQVANYGLPPVLYGIKIMVDPLVTETADLEATSSKSYAAGTSSAYLVARPGSINGNAGGANFSFVHCFSYTPEEMLVEVTDDVVNKRKILSVVDTRVIQGVAPEAGFLFTSVVA